MNILSLCENIDGLQKKVAANNCNRLARRNFSYKPEPNSYKNDIDEFTRDHSIFDSMNIIQLHPSAENGYPHTRPENVICVPNTARFPSLQTTLFHEAIHIHQRKNKSQWKRFLEKEGWTQVDASEIPQRWRDLLRINPDTIMEQFWSFQGHVPLPIFLRPHDPVFDQIKVMWYDMNSGILEHQPPSSFTKKYGSNRQSEHPYEIYAVMMESLGPITTEDIDKYITT
jgi:hypothetical protein